MDEVPFPAVEDVELDAGLCHTPAVGYPGVGDLHVGLDTYDPTALNAFWTPPDMPVSLGGGAHPSTHADPQSWRPFHGWPLSSLHPTLDAFSEAIPQAWTECPPSTPVWNADRNPSTKSACKAGGGHVTSTGLNDPTPATELDPSVSPSISRFPPPPGTAPSSSPYPRPVQFFQTIAGQYREKSRRIQRAYRDRKRLRSRATAHEPVSRVSCRRALLRPDLSSRRAVPVTGPLTTEQPVSPSDALDSLVDTQMGVQERSQERSESGLFVAGRQHPPSLGIASVNAPAQGLFDPSEYLWYTETTLPPTDQPRSAASGTPWQIGEQHNSLSVPSFAGDRDFSALASRSASPWAEMGDRENGRLPFKEKRTDDQRQAPGKSGGQQDIATTSSSTKWPEIQVDSRAASERRRIHRERKRFRRAHEQEEKAQKAMVSCHVMSPACHPLPGRAVSVNGWLTCLDRLP